MAAGSAAPASSVPSIASRPLACSSRVSRRMRNAAKVVQGASLYVFGRITEAEQKMVQKAKALAKATARADPAGAMASPIIRVSVCARSFGEPDF